MAPGSALPEVVLLRDALFLDVDGTLIDIAPTPDAVVVPHDLVPALGRLLKASGGALALVSGRTLENLDELFAPLRLPAAACHGAELRPDPDIPVQVEAYAIPQSLRERFCALAVEEGALVEDKGYTIALHFRRVPDPSRILDLVTQFAPEAERAGLTLMNGKALVELKPRGFDKGTALRKLMQNAPFRGRRPVFAGDDVTDNDGFAVLADYNGIGISVGRAAADATYRAEGPADIRDWLIRSSREA